MNEGRKEKKKESFITGFDIPLLILEEEEKGDKGTVSRCVKRGADKNREVKKRKEEKDETDRSRKEVK